MAGNNWMEKLMKVKEQGFNVLDKGLTQLDQGFNVLKEKGSLTLEKAKLKSQIESINSEINKLMRSVGEIVYSQWENDSNEPISLEEKFAEIKQKKNEIQELNLKIEEIESQEEQLSLGNNGTNIEQEEVIVDEIRQELPELHIEQNSKEVNFHGIKTQPIILQKASIGADVQDNIVCTDEKEVGEEVKETEGASIVCPGCGAKYDNPVRFCRECGEKLS